MLHEFGVDEYIRVKASYAECLMNLDQTQHAIDKFENVKKAVENEIVYENPLLFVNVCNQLGNCYLAQAQQSLLHSEQTAKLKLALDNFESSFCLINRMISSNELPDGITSKICLNIGLIQSELSNYEQAEVMNEKSIEYKRKEAHVDQDDLCNMYLQLAQS